MVKFDQIRTQAFTPGLLSPCNHLPRVLQALGVLAPQRFDVRWTGNLIQLSLKFDGLLPTRVPKFGPIVSPGRTTVLADAEGRNLFRQRALLPRSHSEREVEALIIAPLPSLDGLSVDAAA